MGLEIIAYDIYFIDSKTEPTYICTKKTLEAAMREVARQRKKMFVFKKPEFVQTVQGSYISLIGLGYFEIRPVEGIPQDELQLGIV